MRDPDQTPIDPMELAVAAGRLFNAIRHDTLMQFNDLEDRAWMAFTRALRVGGYKNLPLETEQYLDPSKYISGI